MLTTFACTDLPHFAVFGGKCVNDRVGGGNAKWRKMLQNTSKMEGKYEYSCAFCVPRQRTSLPRFAPFFHDDPRIELKFTTNLLLNLSRSMTK